MANNIQLVQKMLPLLDEVYKKAARSAGLEAPAEFVRESADANSVKIAKMALVGLGNYSKANGFPDGDVSLTWEIHQFTNDRGRRFSIDRMDNIESFSLTAARLVGEEMRTEIVPEVDAYRFAKIASKAGINTASADLTAATTKAALDTAIVTLQEKEVDDDRLVIFMTPTIAQNLSDNIVRTTLNGDKNVNNVIETYNGIQIVRVPQTRFYSEITLNAGATTSAGGYAKGTNGVNINFIVMDRGACYNVTKLNIAKVFTPDENQSKDAWQFDFRLYHDTFILDNKVSGIYAHLATA